MNGKFIFQLACMIAVSFICGVIVTRFISPEQAESIIKIADRRLIDLEPSIFYTILPVAVSIIIVLLFATHPYFYYAAVVFIALKTVFIGFSSIYLMEVWDATSLYIRWWFPFQFIYILILILLYKICGMRFKRQRKKAWRLIPFVFIVVIAIVYFETVVISYVFK